MTIAFAAHHVFISEADNTLARVDPGADCIDGVLNVGGSQITVFAGQNGLYVGFDLGAFALIDPATLTVRRSVRVSTSAATPMVPDYIGAPMDAFGSIWDPTCSRDTVLRMEPLA